MAKTDPAAGAVVEVEVERLKAWAANPRRIGEDNLARLKHSLQTYGMVQPILACEGDRVLGGHQRLTAAMALDWKTVPVIYKLGLTEAQKAALTIMLNNPQAQGEYDTAKLVDMLSKLDAEGLEVMDTGYSEADLAEMLAWFEEHAPGDDAEEDAKYKESGEVLTVTIGEATMLEEATGKIAGFLKRNPAWKATLS